MELSYDVINLYPCLESNIFDYMILKFIAYLVWIFLPDARRLAPDASISYDLKLNRDLNEGTLKRGAHSKHPPMAFTEQGVAMLSSVLNSPRAIEVNIAIMRAFVHLRKMIASHKELAKKLKELEQHIKDHDEIQQLISLP